MKIKLPRINFARLCLFCAVSGVLFLLSVSRLQAQTTTFAQFLENNGTQDFIFTNNTTSADFNTLSGGSSVSFRYQNISGLNSALQGFQDAHLFITTAPTTAPATLTASLNQPLNQTVVISIVRDTPAPVGSGTRTNLLTATISANTLTPAITGNNLAQAGNFTVTTPSHTVVFTSDFIRFNATTQRNLSLSFSSIQSSLAMGTGNFLQSFTAAGTGTFAANPAPIVAVAPTAAGTTAGGRVTESNGRGIFRALVTMTDASGNQRQAYTNQLGYYNFEDVASGQTYIFTARHRRYLFDQPTQVQFIGEEQDGINFTGTSFGIFRFDPWNLPTKGVQ